MSHTGLKSDAVRALSNSALEPRLDLLSDHRSLELGKGTGDLKQSLCHRQSRVDGLLIRVKVHADRLKIWMVPSRSMSERPSRSMARAITTSKVRRPASFTMRSRPGRWVRPLAPLMPASV